MQLRVRCESGESTVLDVTRPARRHLDSRSSMSSTTACRSSGSGESNSTRRPSRGMRERQPGRVQERPLEALHRAQVRRRRAGGRRRRSDRRRSDGRSRSGARGSGACGRWRSPPCSSDTPLKWRADVTRVTALRARRARVDIFCRCCGSRPIGASMRLPGLHDAPDQRDVFLLDLAVVRTAATAPGAPRRSWRPPSRPTCRDRADARSPAAARRRCRSDP